MCPPPLVFVPLDDPGGEGSRILSMALAVRLHFPYDDKESFSIFMDELSTAEFEVEGMNLIPIKITWHAGTNPADMDVLIVE